MLWFYSCHFVGFFEHLLLSLVCHWWNIMQFLQGTCDATSRAYCCQLGWYWQASHVWMPKIWRIIPVDKWSGSPPSVRASRGTGTILLRGLINHAYEPRTKWDDPPSRGTKMGGPGNSLQNNWSQRPYIKKKNISRHNKLLGGSSRFWSVVGVNFLRWNLDLHRKALDKGDRDGSLRKWENCYDRPVGGWQD